MVPFSFRQTLLQSRVMKERSLPSSPLTGAKPSPPKPLSAVALAKGDCAKEESPPDTFPPNWVQRHAGLVGQTCRFAPIKKSPVYQCCHRKIAMEPNLFPETQPAHGILHFLSVSICVHP